MAITERQWRAPKVDLEKFEPVYAAYAAREISSKQAAKKLKISVPTFFAYRDRFGFPVVDDPIRERVAGKFVGKYMDKLQRAAKDEHIMRYWMEFHVGEITRDQLCESLKMTWGAILSRLTWLRSRHPDRNIPYMITGYDTDNSGKSRRTKQIDLITVTGWMRRRDPAFYRDVLGLEAGQYL